MPSRPPWQPKRSVWRSCAPSTRRPAEPAARARAATERRSIRCTPGGARPSSAPCLSGRRPKPANKAAPVGAAAAGEGRQGPVFGPERYRSSNLANQMTASRPVAADPLFGAAWAAAGLPRPSRPWNLPVINALAAGAVIAGVAYRIWEANLPAPVLREEAALIALGVVLTAVAVAGRGSRLATSPAGPLPRMASAAAPPLPVLRVGRRMPWGA